MPWPPPQKRKRTDGCDSGEDPGDGSSRDAEENDEDVLPSTSIVPTTTTHAANKNVQQLFRQLSRAYKLTPAQSDMILSCSKMSSQERDGYILAMVMSLQNKVDDITTNQPQFVVAADTDKNIEKYALAVFTSAKVLSFKGAIPAKHLEDIVKRQRFGLPPNIEKNAAAWAKVYDRILHHFTQLRSKIKKLIVHSLMHMALVQEDGKSVEKLVLRPKDDRQTLYDVTSAIVGDNLAVTAAFASRVAVMRAILLQGGDRRTYWDRVDARLEWLRKNSGEVKRLQRALKSIVKEDQQQHGSAPDEEINEVPDDFQCGVDEQLPGDMA
ncbi:hypothetical protein PUNSTDRAFT_45801 [Punctularia strigosozonata HHB-11173 SS5]|uniref:uncharacterized protein n=1 Tax=Punctularia strigosozonata (strain HHB-11173) TaxID=741275 RepID=UPI00044170E9|nr:uncharacterized protein PUNSTDRAFT_45801 [Punctularia strigosozonata HHB-11173 SS5]EIN07388.1 hypothetical protein PUNSTDRAFT_45801 [Punctularia strigosozonata HHB-11173 SS5]